MDSIHMSTERLRHLLREIRDKKPDYTICASHDISGPGGGVYITAKTVLDEKHLAWIEHRNPSAEEESYVDVVLYRGTPPPNREPDVPPPELDLPEARDPKGEDRRQRAESTSAEVGKRAMEVARQAAKVFKAVNKADFTVADLRQGEMEGALGQLTVDI